MTLTANPFHQLSFRLPKFRNLRTSWNSVIAVLVISCLMIVSAGCSTESTKQVVQDIANAIPTVQTDITLASDIAQTVDPGVAVIILGVTATVQASLTQLQVLCSTYAATQDATILASMQDAFTKMLNTNANALLDAAHIVDPASRAIALKYLGAIQTALQLAYSIYQKIQTKAQITATVTALNYRLKDISPYLDHDRIETATGVPYTVALHYETSQGF